MRRRRRIYTPGQRCQDCGWIKPTTVAIFWLNAMEYRVCSQCIKAYRRVILRAPFTGKDGKA